MHRSSEHGGQRKLVDVRRKETYVKCYLNGALFYFHEIKINDSFFIIRTENLRSDHCRYTCFSWLWVVWPTFDTLNRKFCKNPPPPITSHHCNFFPPNSITSYVFSFRPEHQLRNEPGLRRHDFLTEASVHVCCAVTFVDLAGQLTSVNQKDFCEHFFLTVLKAGCVLAAIFHVSCCKSAYLLTVLD